MISEKAIRKFNQKKGAEVEAIRYFLEENGEKKFYDVFIKNDNDELHYLIQRLSEVEEGEEVILEYKRKGLKGFIELISTRKASESAIPIEEDDENEQAVSHEGESGPDVPVPPKE